MTTRASSGGDVFLRSGAVVASDGTVDVTDILVRDGVIERLGHIDPPQDVPVVDASRAFVLPGLVNAHTHSGENFNPGRYENLPLDLWFVHSHEVTREETLPPETIYLRTLLGALLMLRSGTTCAVDFLYEAPKITPESLEAVVRGYTDAGMRATILLGVADKPFLDSLPLGSVDRTTIPPEAPPPSTDQIMALAREAVDLWHDPDGLVRIGFGPSAPQRCTPELMRETFDFAMDRGLAWHTHVQETRTQAYTARLWDDQTFIRGLATDGFLGPGTAVVHAVWLTDDDIRILAETGTTMIHCLLSNLRLGDGIARLPDLMDAGVRVALGTDGRGCDESLDMIELTKMTALVHKVHGHHYERWPSALDCLAMATRNGSIPAVGAPALGRIEPGAAADLVLIDRQAPELVPLNDPVRQIVYGSGGRVVQTVVVDGRVVLTDGRPVRMDPTDLLARAADAELAARPAGGSPSGTEELERLVRSVYETAEAAPLDVSGYIAPQDAPAR